MSDKDSIWKEAIEEKNMPYITTAERIGIEKGERRKAQDAIIEVLETRLELISMKLIERIKEIKDVEILSSLLKKAVLVNDLEEFERIMNKVLE